MVIHLLPFCLESDSSSHPPKVAVVKHRVHGRTTARGVRQRA